MADKPLKAHYEAGRIHVEMESGLQVSFPIQGNPRPEDAVEEQLGHIEPSPFGLHWPELDEDLSIRGILAGDFGQRRDQAA